MNIQSVGITSQPSYSNMQNKNSVAFGAYKSDITREGLNKALSSVGGDITVLKLPGMKERLAQKIMESLGQIETLYKDNKAVDIHMYGKDYGLYAIVSPSKEAKEQQLWGGDMLNEAKEIYSPILTTGTEFLDAVKKQADTFIKKYGGWVA